MHPRTVNVDIQAGHLEVLVWAPEDAATSVDAASSEGVADPKRAGSTVLALHGFPESAWEWAPVAEILVAEGIRVIAPNQRGYSPGARPPEVGDYAIEHLAADAFAVADHFGLPRVHLVGHDWGASVAWWMAAHHPDRAASLTAVSIPHLEVFAEALESDPEQQERSAYFRLFRQEDKAEDVLLDDGARRLRAMFGPKVPEELVERHLNFVGDRAGLTGALNWYRAMRRYELPDVTVPTTYLWGENDPAIARSGAEATGSRVSGDYRFLPLAGIGHWVPEEAAEITAREISGRLNPDAAPA